MLFSLNNSIEWVRDYMYNSFYEIAEQQQNLVNLFNDICTQEINEMQQKYCDMIIRLQYSIEPILQNISTLTEPTVWMKSFNADKFVNTYNHAMEMYGQFIHNIRSTLANTNFDSFVSLSQQITLPKEIIERFSLLSLLQSESVISNLYDTIQNIPDFMWNFLSEEGYSQEEIQAELEVMKEDNFEISNINGLTPDQVAEKTWVWLWKKHPKVAMVLILVILTFSAIDSISTAKDIFLPIAQNVIVKMQGNEDIFIVKVDSAKLYTDPNSHSTIITQILYSEEVTVVESTKLWDKVIYFNPDGEKITGWTAKGNLMTYKDYEFNSNDLYKME